MLVIELLTDRVRHTILPLVAAEKEMVVAISIITTGP
jgi:hypothetical protein